jgi:hypothetical protein
MGEERRKKIPITRAQSATAYLVGHYHLGHDKLRLINECMGWPSRSRSITWYATKSGHKGKPWTPSTALRAIPETVREELGLPRQSSPGRNGTPQPHASGDANALVEQLVAQIRGLLKTQTSWHVTQGPDRFELVIRFKEE